MTLHIKFKRISRVELFNYTAKELLSRFMIVLQHEIARRHTFCFPANIAHKKQRAQSIRNLIHDLRLLREMEANKPTRSYRSAYIEGAPDPIVIT